MSQAARALDPIEDHGAVDLGELLERLEASGVALGDDAIWYIGHQIAGELVRAHGATDDEGNPAPVLHLGLRPGLVFIEPDGHVRLSAGGATPNSRPNSRPNSKERQVLAEEEAFAAPEQRGGGRVTHRTDVYRLGLLLWSLLARLRPPSDGSSPARLAALRGDLSRAVVDAIDAALEPAPNRRTITSMELHEWLGTVVREDAGQRELADRLVRLRREPKRAEPKSSLPRASDRGAKPLSPLSSIAVAMITAILVVITGVYIGDRIVGRQKALPNAAPAGKLADFW